MLKILFRVKKFESFVFGAALQFLILRKFVDSLPYHTIKRHNSNNRCFFWLRYGYWLFWAIPSLARYSYVYHCLSVRNAFLVCSVSSSGPWGSDKILQFFGKSSFSRNFLKIDQFFPKCGFQKKPVAFLKYFENLIIFWKSFIYNLSGRLVTFKLESRFKIRMEIWFQIRIQNQHSFLRRYGILFVYFRYVFTSL